MRCFQVSKVLHLFFIIDSNAVIRLACLACLIIFLKYPIIFIYQSIVTREDVNLPGAKGRWRINEAIAS